MPLGTPLPMPCVWPAGDLGTEKRNASPRVNPRWAVMDRLQSGGQSLFKTHTLHYQRLTPPSRKHLSAVSRQPDALFTPGSDFLSSPSCHGAEVTPVCALRESSKAHPQRAFCADAFPLSWPASRQHVGN